MMNLLRGNNRYSLGPSDDWFRDFFPTPFSPSRSLMRTDIREESNQYVLEMDVPGFNKEDIKISLENGYMTIEAKKETSEEQKDREGNYIRRERYYGSCSRSFYVGNLRQEMIQASYQRGLLTIRIPKEEEVVEESKKYISID